MLVEKTAGKLTTMTIMVNGNNNLGDTTLTKVFVGGLAWETPKEAMRDHFEKYGEILEAVIISDKATGRSKGYGFVTFKEPEAAKKACEEASPLINGRRANCNLASLGARRPRHSPNMPPPPTGPTPQGGGSSINVVVVGPRGPNAVAPAPWYYPTGAPPSPVPAAVPYVHHQQAQAVPYYGYVPARSLVKYSPAYIATDHMNYNPKVGYTGGSYVNGHYSQMYPGQPMMPVYPVYHFHHQPQPMGLPAQLYSPTTQGPLAPLISKPTSFAPPPNAVCLAVE